MSNVRLARKNNLQEINEIKTIKWCPRVCTNGACVRGGGRKIYYHPGNVYYIILLSSFLLFDPMDNIICDAYLFCPFRVNDRGGRDGDATLSVSKIRWLHFILVKIFFHRK